LPLQIRQPNPVLSDVIQKASDCSKERNNTPPSKNQVHQREFPKHSSEAIRAQRTIKPNFSSANHHPYIAAKGDSLTGRGNITTDATFNAAA
jgi:hypothetical protein